MITPEEWMLFCAIVVGVLALATLPRRQQQQQQSAPAVVMFPADAKGKKVHVSTSTVSNEGAVRMIAVVVHNPREATYVYVSNDD